jgi:TPR repeat protein
MLGRVLELQKDEEKAIRTYENAVKLGHSPAIGPLFRLLARADRFDDIDALIKLTRKSNATFSTTSPERLATEVCVLVGKSDGADRFLNLAVQNYGASTPAVKAWHLTMLDRLRRSDEVENRLRGELERPDRSTFPPGSR